MIKRSKGTGTVDLLSYVCDSCIKEMPGEPIMVYFPFTHMADSVDGPSHFCSDKCLVEFSTKLSKKFGAWKSTGLKPEKPVKTSAEWRAERVKTPQAPKARSRSKTPKKNKRQNQENQNEPGV